MTEPVHVQGFLQLKQKGALADSWKNFSCVFDTTSKVLQIKSKDGSFVHWEHKVTKAWALETKSFRRANRFDVETSDGLTCAFAAPNEADMTQWIEVLTQGKLPSSAVKPVDGSDAITIGDEVPPSSNDFLLTFGAEDDDEEQAAPAAPAPFDIAGDEADGEEQQPEAPEEILLTTKVEELADASSAAVGRVLRYFSNDEETLIDAPTTVSEADNAAEAAAEAADLDEAEQKAVTEELAGKKLPGTYKDISELLGTHNLGQFVMLFHHHGIDTIAELRGCTDSFLAKEINMKKAHILKFRRALKDAGEKAAAASGGKLSVWEAVDGYRGTYEEVCAHEAKLERLAKEKGQQRKYSLYEAPDGFRGTYKEVLAHERKHGLASDDETKTGEAEGLKQQPQPSAGGNPVVVRLYEASDGFRGAYEDVLAHEEKLRSGATGEESAAGNQGPEHAVLLRVYEASDGFRGSYHEVLEHEDKIASGTSSSGDSGDVLFRVYEASDGFRGSYAEVVAHEERVQSGRTGLGSGGDDDILFRLYEASDGFRGTYEEVLAHESGHASSSSGGDSGEVLFRLYEASDGFRGSYEQVVAHENMLAGNGGEAQVFSLYETVDGKFKGTYEECVAYEELHELVDEQNHALPLHLAPQHDTVILRVYEASDGFRGSYQEVVEHEEQVRLNKPLEAAATDPAAKAAVQEALAMAATHRAEAAAHKAEVERQKTEIKMVRQASERAMKAAAPEVLTFNCEDGVDVSIGEAGRTLKVYSASYAATGFNDVSAAVEANTVNGVFAVEGGVHNVLGDPSPGTPKHFVLTYAVI